MIGLVDECSLEILTGVCDIPSTLHAYVDEIYYIGHLQVDEMTDGLSTCSLVPRLFLEIYIFLIFYW